MADEEALRCELGDDLHAGVVVAVVAEDVLFGDRPCGDVEGAGVLGASSPAVQYHKGRCAGMALRLQDQSPEERHDMAYAQLLHAS